jgi:hypothetical protein
MLQLSKSTHKIHEIAVITTFYLAAINIVERATQLFNNEALYTTTPKNCLYCVLYLYTSLLLRLFLPSKKWRLNQIQ